MDVTVSSIGNAKASRGGELLLTQLKGGNGEVYAVAQGEYLVVSGFGAEGSDGSSVSVNTKASGRIPNGALIEREVGNALDDGSNRRSPLTCTLPTSPQPRTWLPGNQSHDGPGYR